MDRSNSAPRASQPESPAHREMMFCHECANEWYRYEHGLSCPECHSEFTEIIEDDHDPRDNVMMDDDDFGGVPDFGQDPPHMHSTDDSWQSDDPEEADISNFHFTQTAPGRMNIRATITQSVPPQGLQGTFGQQNGLMSLLSRITDTAIQRQGLDQQVQNFGRPGNAEEPQTGIGSQSAGNPRIPIGNRATEEPQVRAGRFTFQSGAQLFPRDTNNPQPHVQPVEDIANVMTGLMAAFGAPPDGNSSPLPFYGVGAVFNDTHNPDATQMPTHPVFQILNSLGLMTPGVGSGQIGDFVYSQEGLDRIVSQLMEQTAPSNAPGPAAPSEIDALPRQPVTQDMLGPEHKAECSICMDEVYIGENVTLLPCNHWFHHPCITAWLSEHDTCPHCRKGISQRPQGETPGGPNEGQSGSVSGASAQ